MGINISFHHKLITIADIPGWKTNIHVRAIDNVRVRRTVRVLKQLIIIPRSVMIMPIEFEAGELPNDRNYIFKLEYPGVCVYLVDASFHIVHVRNDTDRPVKIDWRNRLGKFINMKKE